MGKVHNRRNDPVRGGGENYERCGNVYKKKIVEINQNQIGEELSKLNNAFMESSEANIDDNHNNSNGGQGSYYKKNYTKA